MRFPLDLNHDAEFDVVGFGTNAVDYLIQVPEYPAFDSKIELTEYVQAPGGEVATTMVGLQRLGLKTSYVGRFGTDAEGDLGLSNLRSEGVDVSSAEQIRDARTQIAFIVIDERSGERTVIWKRDAALSYREDEVSEDLIASTKVLHFTPHDTRACIKLAGLARQQGSVVSIDIDNVFEGIEDLLPLVDVLIASAEFPQRFLGIEDPRTALRELHGRYGCRVTGLTQGETGSLTHCGGEFFETGGFQVPGGCRDTTGAGDSYRAGFLYGLLKNRSVEESARTANAVAALKCREVGARTALPDQQELDQLLGG